MQGSRGSFSSWTFGSVSATKWVVLLVISIVSFVMTYAVAVLTSFGQNFENAALRGAEHFDPALSQKSETVLEAVSIGTLAIAVLILSAFALLRRQPLVALVLVGVIVGGQILTQVLKRFVLSRPDLADWDAGFTSNSFPSGHTTVFMTLFIALLLVLPYRVRGGVLFVSAICVAVIGTFPITATWHRLSDVVGSALIALGLGAIAALVLFRAKVIVRVNGPRKTSPMIVLASVCTGSIAFIGLALAFLAQMTMITDAITAERSAYFSVNFLGFASLFFAALIYWGSWKKYAIIARAHP